MAEIHLECPPTTEALASLKAGDQVYLSGTIYTARDAAHGRMAQEEEAGNPLPLPIENATIYYVGPTPHQAHQIIGAAGPTTSGRMDQYTPKLLDMGLKVMIGKGARSKEVEEAVVRNGAVYLAALGGGGALMSQGIKECEVVAWEDLGCEAVRKLQVSNLPLTVILDTHGGNLYKTGPAAYLESIR